MQSSTRSREFWKLKRPYRLNENVKRTVLLSGAGTSPSEVPVESKDPRLIVLRMPFKGRLTAALSREFLNAPLPGSEDMRSFDLKAIRQRVAFGAQDDRM